MIFKFIIRNIKKHSFLNSVKVFGLSLAFIGILFIVLLIKYETSYDKHFHNSDNIYRLSISNPDFLGGKHFARIFQPYFIPDIKENFSDVQNYVRLSPIRGGVLKHNRQFYSITQAYECDSMFLSVFKPVLHEGRLATAFNNPNAIIISQAFSTKVFGSESAIGKTITLPEGQFNEREKVFTVTGVMKDFPNNTHFHPDVITNTFADHANNWGWTYLLVNNNADITNLETKLSAYVSELFGKQVDMGVGVHLQNITDIHLYSHKLREIEANGNIANVYVLAIAVLVLLLIALSNYANLNAGMSGFAASWLGINKIIGAPKKLATKYYLLEGALLLLFTLIISVIPIIIVNRLFIKAYHINLINGNLSYILVMVSLFVTICLLISILTALKYVGSQAISKVYRLKKGVSVNHGIIVAQYALTISLLVSVLVIVRQTHFSLSHSMGNQSDNIICIPSIHQNLQQKFAVFKQELLKNNVIEYVTGMQEEAGGEANDAFPFKMEGYQPKEGEYDHIGIFACDYSFPELFNLTFLAGNTFSANNSETDGEYIINKSAAIRLGYSNAVEIIGKQFQLIFEYGDINLPNGKIIGVVDDFHLSSTRKKIEPLVLFKRESLWLMNYAVSYKPNQRAEAIKYIRDTWNSMFPNYPFYYEDVNAMYRNIYKPELIQARLLSIFTIVAIIICSMGLLGISLLTAQNRTKEIGVRKVNGATTQEILLMLNTKYAKLVIIAFIIASPISYYAMLRWLDNFVYKTNISWGLFAVSGVVTMFIALLTVSRQSYKAASKNPVEALRYE